MHALPSRAQPQKLRNALMMVSFYRCRGLQKGPWHTGQHPCSHSHAGDHHDHCHTGAPGRQLSHPPQLLWPWRWPRLPPWPLPVRSLHEAGERVFSRDGENNKRPCLLPATRFSFVKPDLRRGHVKGTTAAVLQTPATAPAARVPATCITLLAPPCLRPPPLQTSCAAWATAVAVASLALLIAWELVFTMTSMVSAAGGHGLLCRTEP